MYSIAALESLVAPASDVLSVLGTVVSTRYLLRRYLTISSLLPPAPPNADVLSVSAKEKEVPKVKGWGRFFTKKALSATRDFFLIIGIQWGIVFGLPRLANRMVQDVLWCAAFLVGITFISGCASTIILPNPMEHSLERKTPSSGLTLKEEDLPSKWRYSEHLRTVFALSIACAVLISGYHGVHLPIPLVTGLFSTQMTVLRFPKMKVMVKLVSGVLIGGVTLTAVLVPVFEHFFGTEAPNSPKRPGVVLPSQWLMPIMSFGSSALSVMVPSVTLSMTYRFEYSQQRLIETRINQTSPLLSPAPFPCPLYKAGLVAMTSSLFLSPKILAQYYPSLLCNGGLGMMGMYFTTPWTLATVMLGAWMRGDLKAWWDYSESWIPTKEEARLIWEDRAEMAWGKEKLGLTHVREGKESEEAEVEKIM